MNIITILIIAFVSVYLANFLLDHFLSWLNHRHQKKYTKPPAIFASHVTQERYESTLAYNQTYYHFGIISSSIHAVCFLAFVYLGLLNAVDIFLQGYVASALHRGILFYCILGTFSFFLNVPFDLYSTFVIEEKFGFNRQTFKLWFVDQIKSTILSLVLLVPLGYAVFSFIHWTGEYWWLYSWALFFGYSLFLAQIYPTWIAPIFNKFSPLQEGELRTKIEQLAQKANFNIQNIYVMDATTRSKHSNAYFAGFGKTKRLVLYDTLIQDFTTDEILIIVAHEIGHYHKKHIFKQLFTSQCFSLLMLYLANIVLQSPHLYSTFLVQSPSPYMGLLLFSFAFSPIFAFFSPISNWQSWKFEYEADRYGFDLTQLPTATKTMFIKLAEKNLSNLTPHPLYARFNYSHPPIFQRLEKLGLVEKNSSLVD